MIDNINTLSDSSQTIDFFAAKSCLDINHTHPSSVDICIIGIETARSSIKKEIHRQSHMKEQYKYDLASDIIDRRHRHLSPQHSISDKLEREDLIDNKLKHMKEAKAKSNLFTMLRFDIKGFIDPHRIRHNALTLVDVLIYGPLTPLTIKADIEDHLLARNPLAYLASGTTPFGHMVLGRSLGPTGDSPLADLILNGSSSHPNRAVNAFTQQLCHRSHCPDIPAARITEKQFSRAFGGLRDKSASSPSGLYNAHYMGLASKKKDTTSNHIRKMQAHVMELPLTHGFAPDQHLVRYD
jgi:hypothetical protein